MPSTYSTSLKLQLIGTGEQAGVWGTTTNYNLGTLLEQAITGVVTLSMGDATYTMTNFNGLSDEARNAVLVLNGPITSPQYLVAPSGQQKTYIVRNRTGNTVTLTTGSGTNVSIANAASEVVFTDGTNFYSATQFNYINGDLTVTGSGFFGANVTVGGNIFGNASTDQWYVPVGNTAARTSSPINGIIRYNTDGKFYEGYANNAWIRFIVANQGSYTVSYVVVAGGGSGGSALTHGGGGGGGGGYLSGTGTFVPGTLYTVLIGGGGSLGSAGNYGTNGANSSVSGVGLPTLIGIGGGAGGPASNNGSSGGSGGGGGGGPGGGGSGTTGGTATSGQGYAGGNSNPSGTDYTAGGGGGAGAPGTNGVSGGTGGAGASTIITGITTYYGGGGGGGGTNGSGGASGGVGGGGAAGAGGTNPGTSGSASTGGGGGGSSAQGTGFQTFGSNGGSGVVILSVPTVTYTGTTTGSPTITTSGNNTIMTFTASGTYTA